MTIIMLHLSITIYHVEGILLTKILARNRRQAIRWQIVPARGLDRDTLPCRRQTMYAVCNTDHFSKDCS